MDSSARQLVAYSFLVVFANDGTLSESELEMLKRIAMEDGSVDEEEKEVLRQLFARLDNDAVTSTLLEKIEEFKSENGI